MAAVHATCFGCAGSFEKTALKDVGDALFCGNCFARLLRPVVEHDGDPVEALLSRPPPPPAPDPVESALGLCFLCMEPVGADAFVRLREFVICQTCSEELMRDLPAPSVDPGSAPGSLPSPDAPAVAPRKAPPAIIDTSALEGGRPGPRFTPGAGTELCAGCGRSMPGPGSYRVIGDRPFCPACAPLAPRRPPVELTPTPAPTPEPVPVGVVLCDCCVRPLVANQFRLTGGYWLCLACLDSDTALAVAVARARYRRRLARMQRSLDDDGDR
jgi:hypothetical protein